MEIDPSAEVDLTAPTSGSLAGVLFFQDRDVDSGPTSVLVSSSDNDLKGVAYFPTTDVELQGGTVSTSEEMKIVANRLTISGRVTLSCPDTASPFNPTALRKIALSE